MVQHNGRNCTSTLPAETFLRREGTSFAGTQEGPGRDARAVWPQSISSSVSSSINKQNGRGSLRMHSLHVDWLPTDSQSYVSFESSCSMAFVGRGETGETLGTYKFFRCCTRNNTHSRGQNVLRGGKCCVEL
jgi:hypothetical protein